jgi:hypothetical protein
MGSGRRDLTQLVSFDEEKVIPGVSKKTEHSDTISRAAEMHLAPLGCKRVGRSRIWICDQRAWVIMVEFQPTSFSKGSYLNVAPSWLWYPKDHLSFDYGPMRVGGFIRFQSTEQFELEADALAQQAALAVTRLCKEFETAAAIVARLVKSAEDDECWKAYYAAVAAGLVGDTDTSLRLFAQVITSNGDAAWFAKLQNFCAEMASKLSDPNEFRKAVLAIIVQTRAQNKLSDDPNCLDDW